MQIEIPLMSGSFKKFVVKDYDNRFRLLYMYLVDKKDEITPIGTVQVAELKSLLKGITAEQSKRGSW